MRVLSRFFGDEIDRAPNGILAVQGTLRTTQNLDPLQIINIENLSGSRGDINVVDQNYCGIARRR